MAVENWGFNVLSNLSVLPTWELKTCCQVEVYCILKESAHLYWNKFHPHLPKKIFTVQDDKLVHVTFNGIK